MGRLFQREDGSPMPFYLADLPEKLLEKFTNLIELNGGKVEPNPNAKVLTFTVPPHAYNYKYVFNVRFIQDCVENGRIVDIDQYFIGDSRIIRGCPMSKLICGTKTCLLNQLRIVNTYESEIIPKEPNFRIQEQPPQQTLKRALELSPVSVRKKSDETVINVDEEVLNAEIPMEIDQENQLDFEPHLSDSFNSFEDDEFDRVSNCKNEIRNPTHRAKFRVIDEIINNKELKRWVEDLNKDKLKDADGYPKNMCRSYSPWESRNLIKLVVKTNTYDQIHSENFWMNVVKLKLLGQSRNYKSAYKHFNDQIVPKIEQFHLAPEIEAKFIKWREKFAVEKEKKLKRHMRKKLAKKKQK